MIRSMYSGVSGLKNFQTKLDVIGNNISNVSTFGYKKGRVVFKDMFSQNVGSASNPTNTRGGVNAKQVGLGGALSSIDTIMTGGNTQTTGNTLDLAIEGDGFFQVAEAKSGESDSGSRTYTGPFDNVRYTRAGNFYVDSNGYLVNGDGLFVVGAATGAEWDGTAAGIIESFPPAATLGGGGDDENAAGNLIGDPNAGSIPDTPLAGLGDDAPYQPIRIPKYAQSLGIGRDGKITFVDSQGTLRVAGQLVLAKFDNPAGLSKAGNNYYVQSANSGVPYVQAAGTGGIGGTLSNALEMSNVDLSEEFTEMIVAQRGFQANTRIITTSDQILEELVNLKR